MRWTKRLEATRWAGLILATRAALAAAPEAAAPAPGRAASVVAPEAQRAADSTAADSTAADSTAPRTNYASPSRQPDDGFRGHHGFWGQGRYRSPGLAFALSLTPMPIDFGNLYAENVPWGIVYTSAELALGTGILWIGGGHMMCRSSDCDDWTDKERAATIAFVSGYLAVKLAAGTHASFAAERFNREQALLSLPLVVPTRDGATLFWSAAF
jgi:hypothetical protein